MEWVNINKFATHLKYSISPYSIKPSNTFVKGQKSVFKNRCHNIFNIFSGNGLHMSMHVHNIQ